jgi:hypothetical protein
MNKRKLNTYRVYAIVEMDISILIAAESFEDAVEKSKTLKETDFCKPLGEWNQGALEVSGIFDDSIKMQHEK